MASAISLLFPAPGLLACISVDAGGGILADRMSDDDDDDEGEEHCKVMRSQSFSFHHRYYQNTTIDQPIYQPDRESTPSTLPELSKSLLHTFFPTKQPQLPPPPPLPGTIAHQLIVS